MATGSVLIPKPLAGAVASVSLTKAILTNLGTGESLPVQFNPEEYTLQRENNFAQAAAPGSSAPLLQFVNGNLKTLEMELFLDTYEAGTDVRELTGRLAQLMDIDPKLHAPPLLAFIWGSLSFTCVLRKLSQRFIMFFANGKPARARLQVSFSGYSDPRVEPKEVKRETADYTRLHVAGQGETLSSVAAQVYDDPQLWRPIAIVNDIDDPRRLAPGQPLRIPSLPFRDPDSGEVIA